MNRNRPAKGFVSPLIVQSQTGTEHEENEENPCQEKVSNNLMRKPLRNNLQILNLFEKVIQENKVESSNLQVKNKQDVDSFIHEEDTSIVDPQRATGKMTFNVMYGKISSKKHKTWDNDGLLEVIGKSAILKDLDGSIIGKTTINPSKVSEGFGLIIGNKQVEIVDQVLGELPATKEKLKETDEPLQKRLKTSGTRVFLSPKKNNNEKEELIDSSETSTKIIFNVMYGKITSKKHKTWDNDGLLEITGKIAILKDLDGHIMGKSTINPSNAVEGSRLIIGNKQIEIVDQVSQELVEPEKILMKAIEESRNKYKSSSTCTFKPLFASNGMNYKPLIMPYLSSIECTDRKEQEISIDSCLVEKLREHQRNGIIFLYKCLMGLKMPNYFGAILADEMGLGKTLQCITLIWTMLKKGPYGKPIVRRVLIITPSSLCNNWEKEFIKWLGSHRIFPYVVNNKNKVQDFTKYPQQSIMIISYEMFIKYHMEISEITFDMVVCDEGHRLKNSNVKAAKLLYEIDCKKRIILTGTPIQNDLKEFYTLIDFINPGILGTPVEYKNYYEDPIVASQCPHADDDIVNFGKERATELYERTKSFILRRTQKSINQYLPQKFEMVLFCSLSKKQKDLYSLVTDAWFNKICLEDKSNIRLSIIMTLRKICNHPILLINEKENILQDILPKTSCIPQITLDFNEYNGKITIVQTLMKNLKKSDEKLVLVSYYTKTLDLFETVCNLEGLKFLRLDGTTSTSVRSKIIEQFNTRTNDNKVLLLSAKAGGVGLNLPGASRLVLYDSDWNPASDVQAMARIWRDGQKKNVYIYRLLTTGTIEEKIYQRQISKASLSESVIDANHLGSLKLSSAELKDLFVMPNDTPSLTHDLMNCSCSGQNKHLKNSEELEEGEESETRDCQFLLFDKPSQQNFTINQLQNWQHYKQPIPADVMQDIMLQEVNNNVTFMFKNSTLYKNI